MHGKIQLPQGLPVLLPGQAPAVSDQLDNPGRQVALAARVPRPEGLQLQQGLGRGRDRIQPGRDRLDWAPEGGLERSCCSAISCER